MVASLRGTVQCRIDVNSMVGIVPALTEAGSHGSPRPGMGWAAGSHVFYRAHANCGRLEPQAGCIVRLPIGLTIPDHLLLW